MKKCLGLLILILSFSRLAVAEDSDKATLSKARDLFEKKQFNEAILEYNKIPKSSDRWLLAIEEKAWAYMHLEQYDKAWAEARTLTSPALTGLTTTEPFLLRALTELKMCDYLAVFQTLKDFKQLKRMQIEAIQQLAKNGRNAVSHATLEKWMQKPEDWKAIGPFLPQMPQLFFHDEIMLRAAAAKNMPAMERRLQELAKTDNNENYRILQKLNLVEVESIQRVHMESKFTGTQGGVKPSKDDLVFDDNKNDVWVDELNSYQAKVSLCQKKSGRTM